MRSTGRLLTKVDTALADLHERPGARVLVACSGGPDSTALLLALFELAARRGFAVVPAYLDHGIRSAAERNAERAAVEAVCLRTGLPLLALAVEPGLLEREARTARRSLEETARARRTSLLSRAAREAGCALIALGHTADDQIETLVMRFFQGSGARGLAGMRDRVGNLIRPLLGCTRQEVIDFLSERGQGYHSDSSNDDQRFLRNGVRARLMPVLREIFPGHGNALRTLACKMSDLAAFVEAELDRRDVWQEDSAGGFSAEADAFYAMPTALRAESLYRIVDRVASSRRRLPYRSIDRLLHDRTARADRSIRCAGIRIGLRAGRFLVAPDIVCPGKRGYFTLVAEPAEGVFRAGPYRLSLGGQAGLPGGQPRTISIGRAAVRPPVIVRSRRRGDRVRTAAGATSLKKLLNQWGVPLEARDQVAVVADTEGAVAAIALPWGACVEDRGYAAGRGFITVTSA